MDININRLSPGLYDVDYNLIYSWDDLINNKIICTMNKSFLIRVNYNEKRSILILSPDIEKILSEFVLYDSSVVKIYLSKNIKEINNKAFNNCSKLEEIIVSKENECFSSEDGILFDKDKNELIRYPEGKTDQIYIMPNKIKQIRINGFYDNKYIQKIYCSDELVKISQMCFYGCENLTNIKLSKILEEIEAFSFEKTNINVIKIPKSIKLLYINDFTSPFKKILYEGNKEDLQNIKEFDHTIYDKLIVFIPKLEDLIETGKSIIEINKILKEFEKWCTT